MLYGDKPSGFLAATINGENMIIVTGCPRSGTSLMMDCLRRALGEQRIMGYEWPILGNEDEMQQQSGETEEQFAIRSWIASRANLGRKKRLEEIRNMNPNGFWECRYTVAGVQWHLGINCPKDAICKIVSQGLAMSDPQYIDKIIFMLRHPREVAKSQEKLSRGIFDEELRQNEWVVHTPRMFVQVSIAVSRWLVANFHIPLLMIEYGDLLAEPEEELSRLKDFLGEGEFFDHPINRKLRRSLPETNDDELWPLSEEIYELMRKENWQGIIDAVKNHRREIAAIRGLFCTRLMRPVSKAECLNCRNNETVRKNFKVFAESRNIDWREEPCLFECDSLFVDNPVSIEDSIADNTWE